MIEASATDSGPTHRHDWAIQLSDLGRTWLRPSRDVVPGYALPLSDIIAVTDRIADQNGGNRATRRWRSPAVVATFVVGLVATLCGGTLLLFAFPDLTTIGRLSADAGVPLAALGVPLFLGGATLLRRAERIMQPTARETLIEDQRPPILYLRSFLDDDAVLPEAGNGLRGEVETHAAGFEVMLAGQLRRFGPLIAIGKPGEGLSRLGASRSYFQDDEWQGAIRGWMDEARLIAVMVGFTHGVHWEIGQLLERGHLGKVVFIFPPRGAAFTVLDDNERARRHAVVRESLAATPLGSALRDIAFENLVAFHTRADGGIVDMHSTDECAFDYALAVDLAAYGLLANETDGSSGPTVRRSRTNAMN